MSKIQTIYISKFWGDKDFQIGLNPDTNFLIGPNGTGKTTIISILTSTLRLDIGSLMHLPFAEVLITFNDASYIGVKKKNGEDGPGIIFSIKIREDGVAEFPLNGYEFERLGRRMGPRYMYRHPILAEIKRRIDTLIRLSWVSVNRTSILSEEPERDSLIPDLVLDKLSKDLTGYFSQLQNQSNIETERFQKYIFTSLLDVIDNQQDLTQSLSADYEPIKRKLTSIYNTFSIPESSEKISTFYEGLKHCQDNLIKTKQIGVKDFSFFFNQLRIQSIIKEWSTVTNKQKRIFEKKDLFLEIIKDLFQHKTLIVSPSNELMVEGEDGRHFDISYLSSGERQLLIILGQALLQGRGENFVYIADEPELSLHIEWQEKLVSSIRRLNSDSQIIFATHSPDIVGPYQTKTIRIDKLVYGE